MQINKNGIAIKTPKKIKKRKPVEGLNLDMRRFQLISDECDVILKIPVFSPIMELMKSDGWREIYE